MAIGRPSISLMSPVKSIGAAPLMYEPTANESTGAVAVDEVADAVRAQAARDDDLDVMEALEVEPRPDLGDQVGGHPAALGRRVEADPVEPVAERVGDPERLLGLVLERVDEDDPGDVRAEVAIERDRRLDRVAEDQDERVGHRAGRVEPGQPGPGRGRGPDAAADDRRVVEDVGDVGMDVARPERDHRPGSGRVDALAGGGRPAGRLGEHPEDRRLVQPEAAVPGADPEDDLLRREGVAVLERLDGQLGRVGVAEDVGEEALRLVDPAQDAALAAEHLHDDERVEALALEDALGPGEVHVGRLAGQDLLRGAHPDGSHQPASSPGGISMGWVTVGSSAPSGPGESGPGWLGSVPAGITPGPQIAPGAATAGSRCSRRRRTTTIAPTTTRKTTPAPTPPTVRAPASGARSSASMATATLAWAAAARSAR